MKKLKRLLVSTLLLVLTLSLAPIISHAERDVNCTSTVSECRGVYMENGDKSAGTDSIYFNKGSWITWGVNNNFSNYGQFQVEVQLWRLNPSVKLESHIVPFGLSGKYGYGVTTPGNYMVIVLSGDYSQGRSYAFAYLQR